MLYKCPSCGYVYDEEAGFPNGGIPAGTRWGGLSGQWVCPRCRSRKINFIPMQSKPRPLQEPNGLKPSYVAIEDVKFREDMVEMSFGELSALCSNLSLSCERQYLFHEAALFTELSEYYKAHTPQPIDTSVDKLLTLLEQDMSSGYTQANAAAEAANDRGAKRILKWSSHVTRKNNSLLNRYEAQGGTFLQNTGIYVCEICGYIHIGGSAPSHCDACGAPTFRFQKVG